MAAQIPIKGDEEKNKKSLQKVYDDKLIEVYNGHDGTWVAHPGLVPIAKGVFDDQLEYPCQLGNKREDIKVSANDLLKHGIIDEIIPEPIGGAHRDREGVLLDVKNSLTKHLNEFKNLTRDEIFNHRKIKFLKIGREKGFVSSTTGEYRLGAKEKLLSTATRFLFKNRYIFIIALLLIFGLFFLI